MSHAFLAPSAAHQWLSCTAAPHACRGVPDTPTEASQEGVRCHLVAGEVLQQAVDRGSSLLFTTRDWYRLNHGISPDTVNPTTFPPELLDYAQEYVERAMQSVQTIKLETKVPYIGVEQRLDISDYVPECFGTGDLSGAGHRTLIIDDLKYGKGVQVFAKNNPQLRLYALGVYKEVAMFTDIERVVMRVDQPRLDHDDEDEISLKELLEWGEWVKPIAKRAFEGVDVEFKPSEENCQFCKIKYTCKARAEYNLEYAKVEFMAKPAEQLGSAEIAKLLERTGSIIKWAKGLEAYALKQAALGEKFPGWKLVEGRSNRYILEPDIARQTMARHGFTDYDKPAELKGITELQKLMGKKKFEEVLKYHLHKPRGKPKLALESDPRPAMAARDLAVDDFMDLDEEDESY